MVAKIMADYCCFSLLRGCFKSTVPAFIFHKLSFARKHCLSETLPWPGWIHSLTNYPVSLPGSWLYVNGSELKNGKITNESSWQVEMHTVIYNGICLWQILPRFVPYSVVLIECQISWRKTALLRNIKFVCRECWCHPVLHYMTEKIWNLCYL